ncbi:MAG TPA: N-acetylmuramoyl-L-alanine amidase [Methanosarcinales archaeon]|nr:N-acetylmuramoyl-L-alanine amidase [Methanosarcinales archaeon]
MRVYISPSTQQNNLSVNPLYGTEERVMHLIADEVVPLLKEQGIEVFRGRKEQTLTEMVAESNDLKVDCHIAIHSNAMGTAEQGKARGCEVWIYQNSLNGRKLAEPIYKQIEALTPTADRGIKETTSLYEVKSTKAPACIVEVAFHDNMLDAEWILSNIKPIAKGIAMGGCEFLGVAFKDNKYKDAIEQIKAIVGGL